MKEKGFTLKKARGRQYSAKTIMDADYADDIVLFANTPTQDESLLHSLKQAAGGTSLNMNVDKMEYICFNQEGVIFTLKGGSLKLVDKFMYLGSSVSSTESHINMCREKAWNAINRLSIIWKPAQSDKIKCNFFQAAVELILLYGCTIWILTKHIEKKLEGNGIRML